MHKLNSMGSSFSKKCYPSGVQNARLFSIIAVVAVAFVVDAVVFSVLVIVEYWLGWRVPSLVRQDS